MSHGAHKIKSLAALLIAFVLVGCSTAPVSEPEISGRFNNACLPEAAIMAETLRKNGIDSKVIIIKSEKWSHAVTAYVYPTDSNQIWAWDSKYKSIKLQADWENNGSIANAWKTEMGVATKADQVGN
jgi:hypothetical protein